MGDGCGCCGHRAGDPSSRAYGLKFSVVVLFYGLKFSVVVVVYLCFTTGVHIFRIALRYSFSSSVSSISELWTNCTFYSLVFLIAFLLLTYFLTDLFFHSLHQVENCGSLSFFSFRSCIFTCYFLNHFSALFLFYHFEHDYSSIIEGKLTKILNNISFPSAFYVMKFCFFLFYLYADMSKSDKSCFLLGFPCPECRVPHPDCSMCRAYKQTYGNKFFQFRFASDFGQSPLQKSPSPTTLGKRTPKSKANTPRARARIPITSPTSSDEDEDRYRAALTVSSQRRNRNTKMFHTPVQISPKAMNRSGSHVRSAVKELLRKNDSVLVRYFIQQNYIISIFFLSLII